MEQPVSNKKRSIYMDFRRLFDETPPEVWNRLYHKTVQFWGVFHKTIHFWGRFGTFKGRISVNSVDLEIDLDNVITEILVELISIF